MFHCGKREAGRTGAGITSGVEQGCSPTPGCSLHWDSRDRSLRGDKAALATPAAAHPASCALTQQIPLLLHSGQTPLLLITQAALISAACSQKKHLGLNSSQSSATCSCSPPKNSPINCA